MICIICLLIRANHSIAENGYELWLRYYKIENQNLVHRYRSIIGIPTVIGDSPTVQAAREELTHALKGLLDFTFNFKSKLSPSSKLIVSKASHLVSREDLNKIGDEGYLIRSSGKMTILTANTDIGLLYGVFHFIRLLQTHASIEKVNIASAPKLKLRMLNHWDNFNRTVERGYAGYSIWEWHKLPEYINQRYIDYARANASIGINAVTVTNVNANVNFMTTPYIEKLKALADVFRPYGIKLFLTAKFSAPIELGKLKTADPLIDSVQTFWNDRTKEIYSKIPDFGGYLIKANSEGQPGPQDYKRSHADGANMLAKAVSPYHGIVIWRAFVYSTDNTRDRHKQAYDEFMPLDGKFLPNVMVQVKNGPIDFMPREPFHPLFGAMPKTPLMMEFQITQEYLGQGTHWVYLAPLFKEVLDADTYAKGKGSTVAKVLDGSVSIHSLTGMTGVANIGTDMNWCSHPMAQSNWFALGRLAWDYSLSSEDIAEDWLKMTFTNDTSFINPIKKIMMQSREIIVHYMNPLGLHHIMATGHHYGPGPWVSNLNRPEWNPTYYHKADSNGIGFDRTATGSNALEQYHPEARKQWEDLNSCDEKYLLWFHHVPWNYKMKSGKTLWDELCRLYNQGVEEVSWMQDEWRKIHGKIDDPRYTHVSQLLMIQAKEAAWWRNACTLYFQSINKLPLPAGYPVADHTLEYYKNYRALDAPGNGGQN